MASVLETTNEQWALTISTRCEKVSKQISIQASRNRLIGNMLRIFNGTVAVVALFCTYLVIAGIAPKWVGIASSIFAAIVLMVDTILSPFVAEDSYERLSEYAHYIGLFSEKIQAILSDKNLGVKSKQDRLSVLIELAGINLRDVKAKWPKLVDTPS